MTLSLTCACGARLEIDDKFAGQPINCPDCQRALQVPAAPTAGGGRRTSGLALASILLALIGAFTIVGTLAAVVLGVVALVQIAGKPDRLAGRGYAFAGILLGVVLTAGTLFAVTSIELFGLTALMSDAFWAGKLDFNGPIEIVRDREGYAVKRPNDKWGVYKPKSSTGDDNDRREWDDLLLVQPKEDAVVLSFAEHVGKDKGIEACTESVRNKLGQASKFGLFSKTSTGPWPAPSFTKRPPPVNGVDMREMQFDKRVGSEDKTFLVRVYKKQGDDTMYVLVAGTRRSHFTRMEAQLREALDSFRLLDRNGRPNW